MIRTHRLPAVVVTGALMFIGCGGSDSSSESPDFLTDTAAESAAILQASTGGRAIDVPNALAAYNFEEGFLPENLPAGADGGSLEPGRRVVGYFMGTRGIRLIAVFPDAIVGMYDGSDAVIDEAARAELFVEVIQNSVYATG